MAEFTIPVVIDPAILEKLKTIEIAIHGLEEGIEELKKIKLGTGLNIGVDLDEEAE